MAYACSGRPDLCIADAQTAFVCMAAAVKPLQASRCGYGSYDYPSLSNLCLGFYPIRKPVFSLEAFFPKKGGQVGR